MSKQEIRVGQQVTLREFEDNDLWSCVRSFVGKTVVVIDVSDDDQIFDFEIGEDTFGWPVSATAEFAPPRQIRLTIAPATETHCGGCPVPQDSATCLLFGFRGWDSVNGHARHELCIAAEIKA